MKLLYLGYLALALLAIVCTVNGIVLAFQASVLLGILYFFIHPVPFITGIYGFLTGNNLAQMIVDIIKDYT